ncbi:MAG: cytochrome c oxidase subunit 4 [Nocardioidaceae bacterium]|nr:cytochrome c oxidase subunit 4 [Nocardioidaceae bacterium]
MKVEANVIGAVALFFGVVTPIYWLLSTDPTGTAALVMTTLLAALLGFFLAVVSRQIPDRPEDLGAAEVADGAGELGFFPPYSWWPLSCALALGTCVLGVIFGWWLFIIGVGVGSLTLTGFVFEYYRGYHAH